MQNLQAGAPESGARATGAVGDVACGVGAISGERGDAGSEWIGVDVTEPGNPAFRGPDEGFGAEVGFSLAAKPLAIARKSEAFGGVRIFWESQNGLKTKRVGIGRCGAQASAEGESGGREFQGSKGLGFRDRSGFEEKERAELAGLPPHGCEQLSNGDLTREFGLADRGRKEI
ncbi:hypothetical protein HNR46_003347 [Haloferula luteola]|uniref:Uncharacterized protein n=1 Tax=Haloferula luteola TaxID=595692 RepID=A0A840VC21_9BACT|nr:hypothetical protein [Haloferula luteola]